MGCTILSPFEHITFPWSTRWSGIRLLEMAAVSQHALKVISLLYCRSMLGSSWDLHYFLYKHVRCEQPVPKNLQCKWESQAENTRDEMTQRWQKLPQVTDLVCRKASWRTHVWFLGEWHLCWPRLSLWEWCKQYRCQLVKQPLEWGCKSKLMKQSCKQLVMISLLWSNNVSQGMKCAAGSILAIRLG